MSLATIRLTAAQALVRFLSRQYSERDGVRRRAIPAMVGIFGHGNVCGIGQALDEAGDELPFIQAKNEQAMVHMAVGYAKGARRLATLACTASIGPGSTNLATGAATATVNRVPVLLLPSDTFAARLQGPPMQAIDTPGAGDLSVNDALRPLSRFFDRITRPEQLLQALPAAVRVLLDPETAGAVTVSLSQDVQAEAYDYPEAFFAERVWNVTRRPPDAAQVERAVAALTEADRPLVVAGGGVRYSGAEPELVAFCDDIGIPVAETSAGKGASAGTALSVGAIGHSGTRAANALARDADLVLCVGTRLIDLTTGSCSLFEHPGVGFVGLNVAAADADKLGGLPLVADARAGLNELRDVLRCRGWRVGAAWLERRDAVWDGWRRDVDESLAGASFTQGQAIRVLNEQASAEDMLVVASGTPHVDVHKLWDPSGTGPVHMEVGFSCMGHEIPAAIGLRYGAPEAREIYALVGDGTYLMGGQTELVTALQEGLKVTVLVVENHGYQSIHALQRARTGRSFGLELRSREGGRLEGPYVEVDLAANAASLGCAAYVAASRDELTLALGCAREETRPAVIVARVDPLALTLASDCWWDVGVAEVSRFPETRAARALSEQGRAAQRYFG